MNYNKQRKNILQWYQSENREMPWRGESDPYKVWLSEIMLQQTQVNTVINYYHRWLKRFPTFTDVANASQDEVLKYWEGLGYYSRARNFHQSCKMLVEENKDIPQGVSEFMELKGVGEYIAAAVQSICFNTPVGVIDGNVNRVASRVKMFTEPPLKNKKKISTYVDQILDKKRPGDFNQALMDLGRYICKPQNPDCESCPIQFDCQSYKHSTQGQFPVKEAKNPRPHYNVAVGIIWNDNQLLITKRKEQGLLGGLWEFPGGKMQKKESPKQAVKREIYEELSIQIKPKMMIHQVKHEYSHFSVTINAVSCIYSGGDIQLNGPTDYKWIQTSDFQEFAFPKASIKLFDAIKEYQC